MLRPFEFFGKFVGGFLGFKIRVNKSVALLSFVVFAGVLLRCFVALKFQSRAWIDELWVVLNPAYRWAFGWPDIHELQADWIYEIRSWIPPTVLGLYLKFLQFLGITSGTVVLPLVRLAMTLANAFGCVVFLRFLKNEFQLRQAPWLGALFLFFIPEFIHYSTVADLSVLGMPFLLLGLSWSLKKQPSVLGFFCLVFSALIRFQYGVFSAGVLAFFIFGKKWRPALQLLAVGVGLVLADVAYNSWMYGHPLLVIANYFNENALKGMAASYGVTPFYFAFELLWKFATEPVFIALVCVCVWAWKRAPWIVGMSVLFFALHAFIGHKEYRFFYGPAVLLAALAGVSLQKYFEEKNSFKILASLVLIFAVFAGWRGVRKTNWRDYETPSLLETKVGARSDVKGLITYGWGGIYSGGAYTFYRSLPYVYAENRADLKNTALRKKLQSSNFNYIILSKSEAEQGLPCSEIVEKMQEAFVLKCSESEIEILWQR